MAGSASCQPTTAPPHPPLLCKSKDGDCVHSCPARFHFQDICTIRCGRVTEIPPREHEKKGCVPLPRHQGSLRPCLFLPVAVTREDRADNDNALGSCYSSKIREQQYFTIQELLETQNLRSHLRPTKVKSAFNKIPRELICTLLLIIIIIFEAHWPKDGKAMTWKEPGSSLEQSNPTDMSHSL